MREVGSMRKEKRRVKKFYAMTVYTEQGWRHQRQLSPENFIMFNVSPPLHFFHVVRYLASVPQRIIRQSRDPSDGREK